MQDAASLLACSAFRVPRFPSSRFHFIPCVVISGGVTVVSPKLHVAFLLALVLRAGAAEPPAKVVGTPRFTGLPSCQSSSCHGGGMGKDQGLIYEKKDVHTRAQAILGTARSLRMAEALGIPDAGKDARCTVCHHPLQNVAAERFVPGVKPEAGVACETCHGPAEGWLRFHTRLDVTHEQRVAAGMRELRDLHGRANACLACHLNIDSELVRAGHPEMFFELDGQMRAEPPHWQDEGAWLGPRAWLTGQASALRELSWKLSLGADRELLLPRWQALAWLLRQSATGTSQLPAADGADFRAMQGASDRLARAASSQDWDRERTHSLFRRLVESSPTFRDEAVPPTEHRRRAEVLVLAIDRLWQALKANGAAEPPDLPARLKLTADEARAQENFSAARFAAALQQVEVTLVRGQ